MACKSGARYFIRWSTSRFSRNVIDGGIAKALLDRARVEMVYVITPIDRDTDAGWAFDGMLGAGAPDASGNITG